MDHVAAIYDFAAAKGYRIKTFKTAERRNKRGLYHAVEVTLIVPDEEATSFLDDPVEKLEAELQLDSAEALER